MCEEEEIYNLEKNQRMRRQQIINLQVNLY